MTSHNGESGSKTKLEVWVDREIQGGEIVIMLLQEQPVSSAAPVCAVERSYSEVGITAVPSVTFKNRNGGIPIFTQERIEERHRKVSNVMYNCIIYCVMC